MAVALVNPKILRWARNRVNLSLDELAATIGTKFDKVEAWEEGNRHPTFNQAQKIANLAHIPFAFLYLPEPPVEEEITPSIPDLRTIGSNPQNRLSLDFVDLLNDTLFKRDWLSEYLVREGAEPLTFVSSFTQDANPKDVAADIAKKMGVSDTTRSEANSWEDYLNILIRKAEQIGIWVMRSGTVAGNTHRPLSVDEFRGFAITHNYVPLIFINGRDAKAAQIFTLAHELAHIWIGASGISNPGLSEPPRESSPDVERFCNSVAAEFLLPQKEFRHDWNKTLTFEENIKVLTRKYRVSRIVVARRGFDLRLLSWEQYYAFYQQESKDWHRKQAGGGGDYYFSAKARNGENFTRTVLMNALSGRLLLRDAGKLLNISPSNLKNFALKLDIS